MAQEYVPELDILRPGFTDYRFTLSSEREVALPDAVHYACERNSILQSAREAAALRLEAGDFDHATAPQVTRTLALYFTDANHAYVAIDDHPTENILLSRAQEGHESHHTKRNWLVPKNDPLITATLDRAAKDTRIVPLQPEECTVLATSEQNDTSPYAANPLVRAIFGDIAQPYAQFLAQNGHNPTRVYACTPRNLSTIGVHNECVEVRRVGIGYVSKEHAGDNRPSMPDLFALSASAQCIAYGYARGIRRNTT